MKTMTETKTEETKTIDERERSVCGHALRYRLLRDARGYYIEAGYRGESAVRFAGADFLLATSVYGKIVRGTVTPCTLADVVSDLLAVSAGG